MPLTYESTHCSSKNSITYMHARTHTCTRTHFTSASKLTDQCQLKKEIRVFIFDYMPKVKTIQFDMSNLPFHLQNCETLSAKLSSLMVVYCTLGSYIDTILLCCYCYRQLVTVLKDFVTSCCSVCSRGKYVTTSDT